MQDNTILIYMQHSTVFSHSSKDLRLENVTRNVIKLLKLSLQHPGTDAKMGILDAEIEVAQN